MRARNERRPGATNGVAVTKGCDDDPEADTTAARHARPCQISVPSDAQVGLEPPRLQGVVRRPNRIGEGQAHRPSRSIPSDVSVTSFSVPSLR